MKNITRIIIILSVLFYSATSYAETREVLLIPVEDKSGQAKDMEAALTDVAAKEISGKQGYACVSNEQLIQNWFGDMKEEDRQFLGVDTAEWVKDTKMFKTLIDHEDIGAIFEKKHLWKVDLIVMSEIRKEGTGLELYSEIIGMDTGRFYSMTSKCRKDDLKKTIRDQAGALLAKSGEVQKVEADAAVDRVKSVVGYDIATLDGKGIKILADYTARRPNPELQNVDILPSAGLQGVSGTVKISSREGKDIEIIFTYADSQLKMVNVNTKPIEGLSGTETLSVLSKDEYVINFVFFWDKGALKSVKVEPSLNPYGEIDFHTNGLI